MRMARVFSLPMKIFAITLIAPLTWASGGNATGIYGGEIPECGSVCDWHTHCSAAQQKAADAAVAACKADIAATELRWRQDLVAVLKGFHIDPSDVPAILDCVGSCSFPRWPRPAECAVDDIRAAVAGCRVSHL